MHNTHENLIYVSRTVSIDIVLNKKHALNIDIWNNLNDKACIPFEYNHIFHSADVVGTT